MVKNDETRLSFDPKKALATVKLLLKQPAAIRSSFTLTFHESVSVKGESKGPPHGYSSQNPRAATHTQEPCMEKIQRYPDFLGPAHACIF